MSLQQIAQGACIAITGTAGVLLAVFAWVGISGTIMGRRMGYHINLAWAATSAALAAFATTLLLIAAGAAFLHN